MIILSLKRSGDRSATSEEKRNSSYLALGDIVSSELDVGEVAASDRLPDAVVSNLFQAIAHPAVFGRRRRVSAQRRHPPSTNRTTKKNTLLHQSPALFTLPHLRSRPTCRRSQLALQQIRRLRNTTRPITLAEQLSSTIKNSQQQPRHTRDVVLMSVKMPLMLLRTSSTERRSNGGNAVTVLPTMYACDRPIKNLRKARQFNQPKFSDTRRSPFANERVSVNE